MSSKILSACTTLSGAPIRGGGPEEMRNPWKTPPRRLVLEQYIGALYYYAEELRGKSNAEGGKY